MYSYFETLCNYFLFSKYLTSTNMPAYCSGKKMGTQKNNYWSRTTQIREAPLYVIIESLRLYNKLTTTFK